MANVTNSKRTVTKIKLDNKTERALVKLLFHFSKTISEVLGTKGYNAEKIRKAMNKTGLSKKTNIKKSTMKDLFTETATA